MVSRNGEWRAVWLVAGRVLNACAARMGSLAILWLLVVHWQLSAFVLVVPLFAVEVLSANAATTGMLEVGLDLGVILGGGVVATVLNPLRHFTLYRVAIALGACIVRGRPCNKYSIVADCAVRVRMHLGGWRRSL